MNRVPFVSSYGPAGYEEVCASANVAGQTVIDPDRRARFYVYGGCAELEQYWRDAWEWIPGTGWLPCPCPKKGTWEQWLEAADEASAAAAIEAAAIVKAKAEAEAEALRLYWAERKAAPAKAAHAAWLAEEARREEVLRLRASEASQAAKRNRRPKRSRAGGPGRCL